MFGHIVIHIARKSALPMPSDEMPNSRTTAPHAHTVAHTSIRLPEIRISGATAVDVPEKYGRLSMSSDSEMPRT